MSRHCPMCDSKNILSTMACPCPIIEDGKIIGYRDENRSDCQSCGWTGPAYTLRCEKTFGDHLMDRLTHKDKEIPL